MVRLPGICSYDPETVVLAHYRMAGFCGMGQKMDDLFGAFCCDRCHSVIDNRVLTADGLSRADIKQYHLEGILRTQKIWLENGLITLS